MKVTIKTPDEALQDLNTRNGVTYEMRAVTSDGDVLVKYTSGISFDDVAGFAWLADEAMAELALVEQNIKKELEMTV